MAQVASVVGSPPLLSRVITRRQEFDSLFEGCNRLQAISYVVSPDLLLHFFESGGLSEVEVIVGENLTEQYRQALSLKGRQVTTALAELVEQGKLRIFVPKRTIHSKLYVLQRDGLYRIIQPTAASMHCVVSRIPRACLACTGESDLPFRPRVAEIGQRREKMCRE